MRAIKTKARKAAGPAISYFRKTEKVLYVRTEEGGHKSKRLIIEAKKCFTPNANGDGRDVREGERGVCLRVCGCGHGQGYAFQGILYPVKYHVHCRL